MKRLALVCLITACAVFLSATAHAGAISSGFPRVLGAMDGSVTVPVEWDGIWATADSTYSDCNIPTATYSTDKDTICGGTTYAQAPPAAGLNFSCTGTADATSIHETCTGSMTFDSCQVAYTMHVDVTRSANTFHSVTMTTTTYSGTSLICSLLPSGCTRIVTYGTREGPSPPAYCTTPTKRTSWGRLKILYR